MSQQSMSEIEITDSGTKNPHEKQRLCVAYYETSLHGQAQARVCITFQIVWATYGAHVAK